MTMPTAGWASEDVLHPAQLVYTRRLAGECYIVQTKALTV